MSFSVACGDCGLEWSGRRPFAQARNVASPRFHRFLLEVDALAADGRSTLDTAEGLSLGQYVERHGYSERFRSHFLVPLTSALWSTAPERALDFPAAYAIRFFDHHGMLGFGRFRWRTVDRRQPPLRRGAARAASAAARTSGSASARSGATADGVELTTTTARRAASTRPSSPPTPTRRSALLADPSPEERSALGAFRYTANETVLHTDERFLPRARAARASWNYQVNGALEADGDLLPEPAAAARGGRALLRHAQPHERDRPGARDHAHGLRPPALHARHAARPAGGRRARAASGTRSTPGAHLGNGFHEDGLASAVRAAAQLGVDW